MMENHGSNESRMHWAACVAELPAADSCHALDSWVPLFVGFLAAWLAVSGPVMAAAADGDVAYPIAERPFQAELASIDREGNISFRTGGKVRVVAAADLAYWGRYRDGEAGPQFMLADGGLVRADLLLFDSQQLILGDATGLGRGLWDESTLPRPCVRAIVVQPPADRAACDRLWFELAADEGPEDRLLLVDGETGAGTLLAAPRYGRFAPAELPPGGDRYRIVRRGGAEPLSVPAARVLAIRFGRDTSALPAATPLSLWLGLKDGSLVRAAAIHVQGDLLSLRLVAGGELKTTLSGRDDPNKRFWDEITWLQASSPRLTWLSDLAPLGYKQIPFLSVERKYGVDRSVLGTRLRADDAVYPKGIGMQSASRLAYDVAGYRRFEAAATIDRAASLRGSVTFKVLLQAPEGQWQPAYESPILRGGDAPAPISVDLKGASRLALIVDFADRADECDYADWLLARLVK